MLGPLSSRRHTHFSRKSRYFNGGAVVAIPSHIEIFRILSAEFGSNCCVDTHQDGRLFCGVLNVPEGERAQEWCFFREKAFKEDRAGWSVLPRGIHLQFTH